MRAIDLIVGIVGSAGENSSIKERPIKKERYGVLRRWIWFGTA